MSQLEVSERDIAPNTPYVPTLQRTQGQPPPVAANGGLSYMSFDQNGDAGTAKALEDALAEIASGESRRVIDMIDKAPPGPIKTRWGLAFRDYDECVRYIRESNSLKVPEGGVALPLAYTVYERSSYSIVPSNAIWHDPAQADIAAKLRKNEQDNRRRDLYFPQVLRDARRIGEYYPGLSPSSPECMDRLGVSLAHIESKCSNFYDAAEVERVFYLGRIIEVGALRFEMRQRDAEPVHALGTLRRQAGIIVLDPPRIAHDLREEQLAPAPAAFLILGKHRRHVGARRVAP